MPWKKARGAKCSSSTLTRRLSTPVVKYVYTGQLEMAEDQGLQMMIHTADKYQLPRLITLVCNQMRERDIKGDRIADLLISAHKHGKELRELFVERISANRMIHQEEGYKKRMDTLGPCCYLG